MMRWGALVVLLAVVVVFGIGFCLWWPPGEEPNRSSDLGTALMGGGIVGLVLLFLERHLSRGAERRDLQLQLGLTDELPGVHLSRRNLSSFYLPGKDLRHANLSKANLRGTNLSGARLDHANLSKANLRGAKLDATHLLPSETLMPSNDLALEPFSDARLQGVDLREAKYDKHTTWPSDFDAANAGARYCRSWREIFGG